MESATITIDFSHDEWWMEAPHEAASYSRKSKLREVSVKDWRAYKRKLKAWEDARRELCKKYFWEP